MKQNDLFEKNKIIMWNPMKKYQNTESQRKKYESKIAKYKQKLSELLPPDQYSQNWHTHSTGLHSDDAFFPHSDDTFFTRAPRLFDGMLSVMNKGFEPYSRLRDSMNDLVPTDAQFQYESYSNINGDETYDTGHIHNGVSLKQDSWVRDKGSHTFKKNNKLGLAPVENTMHPLWQRNHNPPNVVELKNK